MLNKKKGENIVSSQAVGVSQDEMLMNMKNELATIKSKVKVHDKCLFVFGLLVVLFVALVLAPSIN